MFSPPIDFIWRQKVKIYEEKFKSSVPQWINTLDLIHAIKLLSIAVKLDWQFPETVLNAGEPYSGYWGLWSNQRNNWDVAPPKTGGKSEH